MALLWAVILSLIAVPAIAQQQTPMEQAMSQKLLSEISENVQLREQIIQLQKQLTQTTSPSTKR